MLKEYVIEGSRISCLEDFYDEIIRVFGLSDSFGRNLDAFDDLLSGWSGTPAEGFKLRWHNSDVSRNNLGFKETISALESRLLRCHTDNREILRAQIEQARRGLGPTVFEWIIEVIKDHGPNGRQSRDNVRLVLE